MPSGRYRRRPAKPSSNDSRKDVLYDQLLHSLTGDDSVATQGEVIQWAHEQDRAGQKVPLIDPQAPWPIQRGQALILLHAIPLSAYLYACEVIREAKICGQADEAGLLGSHATPEEFAKIEQSVSPLDEAHVRTEFLQWRDGLIQRYQLEGLMPENPTTSSPESPA